MKIENEYRKMRIILLFDLPSVEKEDIAINTKFVKNLKRIGFNMLQYSVYTKALLNYSDFERVMKKIKQYIPKKGNIILFKMTEKQYNDMIYLRGEKNQYELLVGSNNVIYIGGDDYN